MPIYSLDSNTFIEAKNRFYPFDIFPVFWNWLVQEAINGNVYCIKDVYNELQDGGDELADWIKEHRQHFVRELDVAAQGVLGDIATYVVEYYPSKNADPFLDRADPLIIAQASVSEHIVVTQERPVPDNSKKVKIPNICDMFGVQYIDLFSMMRQLGAQFT